MPAPPDRKRPEKLDAKDHEILKARLRFPEASQQQLADLLELPLRTVNRRVNRPAWQAAYADALSDALRDTVNICKAYAPKAARRLVKIVTSRTSEDRDAINAAKDIITRAIDPKLTIAFDKAGLNVNHSIDPEKLTTDQLLQLEQIIVALGLAGATGEDTA